jgi:hypothetical protein
MCNLTYLVARHNNSNTRKIKKTCSIQSNHSTIYCQIPPNCLQSGTLKKTKMQWFHNVLCGKSVYTYCTDKCHKLNDVTHNNELASYKSASRTHYWIIISNCMCIGMQKKISLQSIHLEQRWCNFQHMLQTSNGEGWLQMTLKLNWNRGKWNPYFSLQFFLNGIKHI